VFFKPFADRSNSTLVCIGRRSAQGCAGASNSSVYGTAAQYQPRPLDHGFLDTDSAAAEWRAEISAVNRNLESVCPFAWRVRRARSIDNRRSPWLSWLRLTLCRHSR